MATKDSGGPAFPEAIAIGPAGDVHPGFGGMSLRDYFAGQALTGLLANPKENEDGSGYSYRTGSLVGDAYQFADQMLDARSK